MKYAIGMLCFFASLVLAACSEDADKGSEHYSGVFLLRSTDIHIVNFKNLH